MSKSLLSTDLSLYHSKEEAVLNGIPATAVVHTADEFYCDEDYAVKCEGCDTYYVDRHELDDEFHCEGCAKEAREDAQHMKDLNADWSASRGCDMRRSW